MKKIIILPKRLARWAETLAGCVLMLMVVHIVADVASKAFFNYPLPGTLSIVASYYMIGIVFLPMALAELTRQSISVDLFFNFFSIRSRWVLLILATVLSIVFYAALTYESVPMALKSMRKGEFVDGTIYLITWPGRFFLPIAFFLVVLVLVYRLIGEIRFGENVPDENSLKSDPRSRRSHD